VKNHVTHSFLALVVLVLMFAGCGGVRVVPTGERVRNADMQFDAAEAFLIQTDRDTEQEKQHEQVQQKKALYDEALDAYRATVKADPTGNYAQRSLWQISEIYSRRYEWDKVVESYNAITAIAPLSYYGDRAKSGVTDMRTYRGLIEEAQRKYQEYSALYAQDGARENYDKAAQALYDVAESYEKLGDYPEAITHYELVVDEFPDYEKAPMALTKIGEIHFYKLFDYRGGWPAYNKVIEMYPDTYDATKAIRLLKETDRTLTGIAQNQAEIQRYESKKATDNISTERRIVPSERYCIYYIDIVVHCFQFIGRRWEDLRNYPSAIVAYRTLVDERPHNESVAADARHQIGRLYQLNGQLDQAIDAYQELYDKSPESLWRAEGIYQQAVCYREIREFTKAYEGFKAYMNLGRDVEYYQEAEQVIRELEMDKDGDGYKSDIGQETGTPDQDPNRHKGVKSFLIRILQGKTEI
jgi:tetratricopeptide (TPR) repeat protein